jgi:hypothetical protein
MSGVVVVSPPPPPPPPAVTQKPPDGIQAAADHTALLAHLTSKYGLAPATSQAALGATPAGRSPRQIEQALTAWARTLPKGA